MAQPQAARASTIRAAIERMRIIISPPAIKCFHTSLIVILRSWQGLCEISFSYLDFKLPSWLSG